MSKKKQSSLKSIGYINDLPRNAEVSDYEKISIKDKKGKYISLYRKISCKQKNDDNTNFSSSWDLYNSLL